MKNIGISYEVCEKTECCYFDMELEMECEIKKPCFYNGFGAEGCPVPKKCPNKALHILSGETIICGDCRN